MHNGSVANLLQEFKSKGKKIAETDILRMFTDVACGLRFLHFQKIIHRDLKPDNILLDEYFNAIVADFGIAKMVDQNPDEFTICGTILYMAPEMFLSTKTCDYAIDTWALGMVFYEMVMLHTPFSQSVRLKVQIRAIH
jgi:serine/threonine protein kinase